MISKSVALGLFAAGCMTAAAGGAYIAVRQNTEVTPAAAAEDLGTLRLWGAIGQRVAIERLLEQMITLSDTTAAVVLAHRVGWHRIDAGLSPLGLTHTRTLPPFHTTAADMAPTSSE